MFKTQIKVILIESPDNQIIKALWNECISIKWFNPSFVKTYSMWDEQICEIQCETSSGKSVH